MRSKITRHTSRKDRMTEDQEEKKTIEIDP